MKALVMVFTFTFLLLCVTAMAISEIVTIDAGLLPGSAQASYVHCWAAATNSTINHVPFPGGRTDTNGNDITCDANKTDGGNSATAHSRARVTGGVLLDATVSATKVTFAAAAAYAQAAGQKKSAGLNEGPSLMVVSLSGLKVTGRRDPMDDALGVDITNLKTNQINIGLINEVVADPVLRNKFLEGVTSKGLELVDYNNVQLYLAVRAKMDAKGKRTVTASAPLLCDPGKLKDAGFNVSTLKVEAVATKVLNRYQEFCGPQTNVDQTSSFDFKTSKDKNGSDLYVAELRREKPLILVFVILPNNTGDSKGNDISLSTAQSTSSRIELQQ